MWRVRCVVVLETAEEFEKRASAGAPTHAEAVALIKERDAAVARAARLELLDELTERGCELMREAANNPALDHDTVMSRIAGVFAQAIREAKSKYGAAKEPG